LVIGKIGNLVIEKRKPLNFMQEVTNINQGSQDSVMTRVPEARYAYYRQCQVFRENGEQCKAPAEKDSHICYAHAGQQALTLRRKLQLMVVLAEVARRMRARGKPEFEVSDIFMDFNAIQVTLAVMAQALLDGRIDCKTTGRLAVGLQTAAKLLRLCQRQTLTTKNTRSTSLSQAQGRSGQATEHEEGTNARSTVVAEHAGSAKIVLIRNTEGTSIDAERAHGPPGWARAA
jgi:hypothetical protein